MIPDHLFRRLRGAALTRNCMIVRYRKKIDHSVPANNGDPALCYVFSLVPRNAPWIVFKIALTELEVNYPRYEHLSEKIFSAGYGMWRRVRSPRVTYARAFERRVPISLTDVVPIGGTAGKIKAWRMNSNLGANDGPHYLYNQLNRYDSSSAQQCKFFDPRELAKYNQLINRSLVVSDGKSPLIGIVYIGRMGERDNAHPSAKDKVTHVQNYPWIWKGLFQSIDAMGYEWELMYFRCDVFCIILNRPKVIEEQFWHVEPGPVGSVLVDIPYICEVPIDRKKLVPNKEKKDFSCEQLLGEWQRRVPYVRLPDYAKYFSSLRTAIEVLEKGGGYQIVNRSTGEALDIDVSAYASVKDYFDHQICDIIFWLNPQTYEDQHFFIGREEIVAPHYAGIYPSPEHLDNIMCAYTRYYDYHQMRYVYSDSWNQKSIVSPWSKFATAPTHPEYQIWNSGHLARLPHQRLQPFMDRVISSDAIVHIGGCNQCGSEPKKWSRDGKYPKNSDECLYMPPARMSQCCGHVWTIFVTVPVNAGRVIYYAYDIVVTKQLIRDPYGTCVLQARKPFDELMLNTEGGVLVSPPVISTVPSSPRVETVCSGEGGVDIQGAVISFDNSVIEKPWDYDNRNPLDPY
jgi:hypothetical protein